MPISCLVAAALAVSAASAAAPCSERATSALLDLPGVRVVRVERADGTAFERAAQGIDPSRPHDVKSASKSVLGALVGIALDRGLLAGLDEPLAGLLPGTVPEGPKREITVRHLLTMTSGLESTSGPAYGAWVSSRDWVRAALERPLLDPPGTRFEYSTGCTHLLAAALERAVGGDLPRWADEQLFTPAGFEVADWQRDPQGRPFGGNGFVMRAADLAAFGRLLLDRGRAGGRQVVPGAWIGASWQPRAEGWPDRYGAYGYLWWLPPGPDAAVLAAGYGGQFLLLLPGERALGVLLSSHTAKGADWDAKVLALLRQAVMCGDGVSATLP